MEQALLGWLGQWEVEVSDLQGNIIERTGIRPNLIMDAGLNLFRDILSGAKVDGEIKYIALGSSSAAPSIDQVQLSSEYFRKLTTFQQNDPITPGKLITELYVADNEANGFKVEEIGWFCGTGATSTANSGVMIARILYSRQKNNLETWNIRRTDTIGRV